MKCPGDTRGSPFSVLYFLMELFDKSDVFPMKKVPFGHVAFLVDHFDDIKIIQRVEVSLDLRDADLFHERASYMFSYII